MANMYIIMKTTACKQKIFIEPYYKIAKLNFIDRYSKLKHSIKNCGGKKKKKAYL